MLEELYQWPEKLKDGTGVLPLPNYDFSPDVEPNVLRTDMDSGRARQRPINTQALETVAVTFELTKREYAVFVAIWRQKLNNGVSWFAMRLPQPNDESLTLSKVRFITGFSPNHRAFENWDISATLEFDRSETLSVDRLALTLQYDGDLEQAAEDAAALQTIFPYDWTY